MEIWETEEKIEEERDKREDNKEKTKRKKFDKKVKGNDPLLWIKLRMCQRDNKLPKEQKIAEGHQWVCNTARKSHTKRQASAGP